MYVCVCMYSCMYVCMHACMHACIYIYICISYECVCASICLIHTHLYAKMNTCMLYVRVYIYIKIAQWNEDLGTGMFWNPKTCCLVDGCPSNDDQQVPCNNQSAVVFLMAQMQNQSFIEAWHCIITDFTAIRPTWLNVWVDLLNLSVARLTPTFLPKSPWNSIQFPKE